MSAPPMSWSDFVITYGRGARAADLAVILDQPPAAIDRLRATAACRRGPRRDFGALFTLWHGRPPRDTEWPPPRRAGSGGRGYTWDPPELALVARLTGVIGTAALLRLLTVRLRKVTGDHRAQRTANALNRARQLAGIETRDVVGGITVAAAAREIGTRSILDHEIRNGTLAVRRVGRYHVIPYAAFAAWKARRVFPPAGFIRLAKLRKALGIRSDKLSEWARAGYIPTAVRCNPYGTRERSTQFGTWYIAPKTARRILADRRAGRPMPWWGKPEPGNLKVTWTLWRRRQHPAACNTCRAIWGPAGAPATWDDYARRYPPLAHGAKRHLTQRWHPGLTVAALAREARVPLTTPLRAIRAGVLRARRIPGERGYRISRLDATRWKARHCPTGASPKSWLAIPTACRQYHFTAAELRRWIRAGRVRSRRGVAGPQRGHLYVARQQVRELRDELGYGEAQAARLVGVSVVRLRVLLRGLEWRPAPRIPAEVVHAAQRRQASANGRTLAEAARDLGKSLAWVRNEIVAGTFRVLRTRWNRNRLYVSAPMFKRLQRVARRPVRRVRFSAEWLLVSDAAVLAGVSSTTVQKWADAGQVRWRFHPSYRHRRYHRRSVKARARRYWTTVRFKRATPPAWLQAEAA